jgi:hypothetical protein
MVLAMKNETESATAVHPSIAGFVAVVRQLEERLSLSEDPTQYVRILEYGTQGRDGSRKPATR